MPKSPLQTSHLIISHSLRFQSFTKPKVCATMSCNGCRVLRKACGVDCVLRPCLDWIESPDAQAHATLFLSKFFGRSDLVNYISSVPSDQRSEIFRSLLYEAAGRTANPINGAMGLLSTGNWHLCEAAVQTVLSGGSPIAEGEWNIPEVDESSDSFQSRAEWGVMMIRNQADGNDQNMPFMPAADVAVDSWQRNDGEEPKLLNLFE